jgi:hypothetical protein
VKRPVWAQPQSPILIQVGRTSQNTDPSSLVTACSDISHRASARMLAEPEARVAPGSSQPSIVSHPVGTERSRSEGALTAVMVSRILLTPRAPDIRLRDSMGPHADLGLPADLCTAGCRRLLHDQYPVHPFPPFWSILSSLGAFPQRGRGGDLGVPGLLHRPHFAGGHGNIAGVAIALNPRRLQDRRNTKAAKRSFASC